MTENLPLLARCYKLLPSNVRDRIYTGFERVGLRPYWDLLFASPLRHRGWFESYNALPVDEHGEPIPWTPYAFIDFVDERLDDSLRVFEYGSGGSTVWYANRVDEIISVEHDTKWFETSRSLAPTNAEVVYRPENRYPRAITEFGTFDVVVIDGIHRNECVESVLDHLSNVGVVIWDDTYRMDRYGEGIQVLRNEGFREIFFQGLGPVTTSLQRTSIFYQGDNCLCL